MGHAFTSDESMGLSMELGGWVWALGMGYGYLRDMIRMDGMDDGVDGQTERVAIITGILGIATLFFFYVLSPISLFIFSCLSTRDQLTIHDHGGDGDHDGTRRD